MRTGLRLGLAAALIGALLWPLYLYRDPTEAGAPAENARAIRFEPPPLPLLPLRSWVRDAPAGISPEPALKAKPDPARRRVPRPRRTPRTRPPAAPRAAGSTPAKLPDTPLLGKAERLFRAEFYRPALRYYESALRSEARLLGPEAKSVVRERIRDCRGKLKG